MTDRGPGERPVGERPVGARAVFLGSGAFGSESLAVLAEHPDVALVGVVTAPPRPADRRRIASTPIHEAAEARGIGPILTPQRLRDPASVEAVLDLRPDLLVLADYGQIVPVSLLEVRHGALNLHPSPLPRHRGATPIQAAILAGDPETAVTLMRMDTGLDTGPLVAQERVALDGTETTPSLEALLGTIAADLLRRSLGPWLRGLLPAVAQAAEGATMTRPLRRGDGRLDPSRSAAEIERRIRALQPWPGSFVDTAAGRLVVWSAVADSASADVGARGAAAPTAGTFDDDGFTVGDGERLRLLEVQAAGGRRMAYRDYLRGRPGIVGTTVLPGSPADVR